ncbi:DUF58 domain-containing protein [Chloroflexota bacterium]
MTSFIHHWAVVTLLKVYVVIALVIAAALSPLSLSWIPILLLAWYLYIWRWRFTLIAGLLTNFFMFFAIALLFSSHVSLFFTLLLSLPVIVLINNHLEEVAELLSYQDTRYRRRPTNTCFALLLISILAFFISLMFSNWSLNLVSVSMIIYLVAVNVIVYRWLPLKPVEETRVQHRVVAGAESDLEIKLTASTRIGGLLFIESPYEWLKVSPNKMALRDSELTVKISLTPKLSGPSIIRLRGQAIDRWGLNRVSFELEPVHLNVIPRARYAIWLATRYLAGSKPGVLQLISSTTPVKPNVGLRRGVEYYGSRQYQPGDSMKNIDWKHSAKYNELISKEFTEFQGRAAINLINLAAGDAEEADILAYNIVVTAVSLAQENIPAALAAYDHEGIRLTTPLMPPQQLVLQSIKITREIATIVNPVRYLNPPDVSRLRANINRIHLAESEASKALTELLQLEYRSLDKNARLNPATQALSEVFAKADRQSTVVIISQHNHDAEALVFNTFELERRGNAVIKV